MLSDSCYSDGSASLTLSVKLNKTIAALLKSDLEQKGTEMLCLLPCREACCLASVFISVRKSLSFVNSSD